MLNTNLPNVELREKKLLLERRHSICLEISKKRRESVASSIFIPKDFLKHIYGPDGGVKTASKTKKILNLKTNKKRHFERIVAKKKLRRLKIVNQKKALTKVQSCSNSLKHPESYPIIKQIISSEEIRCAVEKLRDQNVTQNSECTIHNNIFEVCESSLKSEASAMDILESDHNQIESIQMEDVGEIRIPQTSLDKSICTNTQPEKIYDSSNPNERNADTENAASTLDKRLMGPQKLYSSINRVDNFIIMVDSSGSHVEIKYDENQIPSPKKSVILQNISEKHQYDTKHETSFPNIKTECVESDYIEPKNNSAPSMKTRLINTETPIIEFNKPAKSVSENIGKPYNTITEAMKLNLFHRDKDVTDQRTKETAGNQPSEPIPPIIWNIPAAAYRAENSSVPVQEPRIPSHQNRCCAMNSRPSNYPPWCYNYNTTIHPKLTSQPQPTQYTSINKSHPPHLHNYLNQPTSFLDAPPISPNIPQNMGCSFYGLHKNHQKDRNISRNRQICNVDAPSNVMPNKLNYSLYTNTMYPFVHHANLLPYNLDVMRQASLHSQNSCFSHPHGQVSQDYHLSKKQYHHKQPTKIDFTYLPHETSDYNHLDLRRQFYHPLHQSQLSYPNHFEPMTAVPRDSSEMFEARRLRSNPVTKTPQLSVSSIQSFLPSAASTSIPSNFPFPSPNWTNTHNKFSSVPMKSPSHLNIQAHPYSWHPNLHPDTELTSHLHTTVSIASTSTPMAGSMHNNFWSPTYMHNSVPSSYKFNI